MEFLKTMADELIDIFDENMNLLGTAMKSQAHREGLWHKTFHCWLARKNDEGKIMVWLQLRNKDKSILDVSAGSRSRPIRRRSERRLPRSDRRVGALPAKR